MAEELTWHGSGVARLYRGGVARRAGGAKTHTMSPITTVRALQMTPIAGDPVPTP